ncbi:phosphatase [Streptomyces sp. HB2AG]|uniref:phosphatase n=1 Tax=Streptomyces sp. HB2AG TaxID=2983400 RepID=UPI0022AAADC4|nr:phosphatase [Streptomyces sp. HB2AG]MCZ2525973.1 phosphatase [Streptomyces sp. HB2AG]
MSDRPCPSGGPSARLREELRGRLEASGLAGAVSARREKSLLRYRMFADRDPRVLLGLEPEGKWTSAELLRLMAEKCGVSADPGCTTGRETIDPDRTLAALDRFADRLGRAAERREPVLFGTGHPGNLLPFYRGLAAALSAAGCPVLTPVRRGHIDLPTRFGVRPHHVGHTGRVAVVRSGPGETGGTRGPEDPEDPGGGAGEVHTHSPLPVRAVLDAAAGTGGLLPELVVGDHGWVCGAGQLGLDAVGLADADDPAVFVAEEEGRVLVAVPLDDGVRAPYYRPLTRYVLNRACLSR